jgi:hypothetical protein
MGALFDWIFSIEEINGNGLCPTYLYRWTLLKVGNLFSVYLHKFVGDDWSLDLHDHPKRFWSIGLRGEYTELTPHCWILGIPRGCMMAQKWRAPWFRTFPADHVHRLTGPTPEHPCWTLVIVGPATRPWGFWRAGAWIPWRKYVDSSDARANRSCP